jgi:hypothetical protein
MALKLAIYLLFQILKKNITKNSLKERQSSITPITTKINDTITAILIMQLLKREKTLRIVLLPILQFVS